MIKIGEFTMIRELFQKGWSITAISNETCFDLKTIRKYMKSEGLPRMDKVPSKGSKVDPFKDYLEKRMKEGTTNCNVLLEKIISTPGTLISIVIIPVISF